MEREVSVSLPADDDGFLERACPNCGELFAIEAPEFDERARLNLRCPYCQHIDEATVFLTPAQHEYATAIAKNEALKMATDQIDRMFEDAFGEGKSNDAVSVEYEKGDQPDPTPLPNPITGPDLEPAICDECGFNYRVDPEVIDSHQCPLCRED